MAATGSGTGTSAVFWCLGCFGDWASRLEQKRKRAATVGRRGNGVNGRGSGLGGRRRKPAVWSNVSHATMKSCTSLSAPRPESVARLASLTPSRASRDRIRPDFPTPSDMCKPRSDRILERRRFGQGARKIGGRMTRVGECRVSVCTYCGCVRERESKNERRR
ncbi:predicted protein [Plenodomus lingam JN3]|uniref:Predicted protein n=1 Tax=Leptosphaeria maculans (strain JN3 / isolate v23.1.3 / race Av1-4-5-6-7-8) TaxID=985895 RepID=E5AAE4_LEPMJ|nr:predicted protein [Plenodomus lingam JN3]CBY00635.1 predicted protein [Plenodomus lingam JN3]